MHRLFARDRDLRAADTENVMPERHKLLEREFEAEREQQEYHANLADVGEGGALSKQAETGRPNQQTGQDVSHDAGHADP